MHLVDRLTFTSFHSRLGCQLGGMVNGNVRGIFQHVGLSLVLGYISDCGDPHRVELSVGVEIVTTTSLGLVK
jgi:hypothetical protein